MSRDRSPRSLRIAYLCRGSGYGHAVRALPILRELRSRGDVEVVYLAACGQACDFLRRANIDFHDLNLSEGDEAQPPALAVYRAFLESLLPLDLVIADELFMVPPVARQLGVPSTLLSCFLGVDRPWIAQVDTLASAADNIVVLDWVELHTASPVLGHKTTYTGPLVEPMRPHVREPGATRSEHVVVLGAPRRETEAPARFRYQQHVLRTVLAAWQTRRPDGAQLTIFMSEVDARRVTAIQGALRDIRWIPEPTHEEVEHHVERADAVYSTPSSTLLRMVRSGLRPRVILPLPDAEDRRLSDYLADRGYADLVNASELAFDLPAATHSTNHQAPPSEAFIWADPSSLVSTCLTSTMTGSEIR